MTSPARFQAPARYPPTLARAKLKSMEVLMKLFLSTIAVATVSLFFCAVATPAHAWQEPDERKQEPEKKPEEKPKTRPEERKPEREKPEARPDANHARQEQEEERGRAEHPENRGEHAQANGNARLTERTGHHNSFRIPDEHFHASFGRGHRFHVRRDERTFAFGGYSFELVDPWPVAWSYDDDVFVEFIDGEYYLVDAVHPTLRVLVIVVS